MSLDPRLVKIHEALEEFTKSGALDKVADGAPHTIAVQTEGPESGGNRYMTRSDILDLRSRLVQKSTTELLAIFNEQASKTDVGIPLMQWMAGAGNPSAIAAALQRNTPDAQLLMKAVDSTGAAPLIRQDLEPVLYALLVKIFPAWLRIRKEPANGLVHAWNRITSYGDAQFMPELGTVTDDNNTYERATTNVAVIARRVGISFKSQFAVQQGGAGYNLEATELEGGLRALAHKLQKTIFQGNATASGGAATDENGAYDANGFDGLRRLLNTGSTVDINVSGATPDSVTEGFSDAVVPIVNNGGMPSVIYIRADEWNVWNKQQLEIVRLMDRVEFTPGVRVMAVATTAGDLPLVPIPGDSIGSYDRSAKETADAYIIDESLHSLPFLGSDTISTLQIPPGVGGQLVSYFILWGMFGHAQKSLLGMNKLRIRLEA